jgi:3',5'-cyclic AMP phosphodiesterase CpdA
LSGDLIHEGGVDDYAHLRQLLAAEQQLLGAPIRVILGNHDGRRRFIVGSWIFLLRIGPMLST